MAEPYSFIIYGHPATKKNSSVLVQGQARLLPSKAYREYEKLFRQQLMRLPQPLPHFQTGVYVLAKYWLKDKAHWPDITGLMQATADIISDDYKVIYGKRQLIHRWLLSDDRIIKKWGESRIAGVDRNNPRVEVTITPIDVPLDQECDPYIIKVLKEEQQQSLFG
jgi:hypothetical protein